MMLNRLSFLLLFCLITSNIFGQKMDKKAVNNPLQFYYLEDGKADLKIQDVVQSNQFKAHKANSNLLNFGVNKSSFWIKIKIDSNFKEENAKLYIDQARLKSIENFFLYKNGQIVQKERNQNFTDKFFLSPKLYFFDIPVDHSKQIESVYLKVNTEEIYLLPIYISTENDIISRYFQRDMIFSFYTGIMLVMFLYNLFLYFSVRDKSYIYYVIYILLIWLAQISIQGYGVKFFWEYKSWLDDNSVVIFSLFTIIFTTLFTQAFLNTKINTPRAHRYLNLYFALAIFGLLCLLFKHHQLAFILMQFLTTLGAFIALSLAYYVYFKKKFKPAGYYLTAWSVLLFGAILFIMKDYEFLVPYNDFSIYLLQLTSSIEVMLLSFALADKINFFKQENEIAQAQALNASLENQKLIREQNVFLEKKVKERTEELLSANETLSVTLNNLKETQSQLVDAEKMATLGQLTAGIAHEINNPINFVTSNIKPLELDINDLKDIISRYEQLNLDQDIPSQIAEIEAFKKQIDLNFVNQEINSLLSGISEGAKRTAEIIRSLRNFSRLDENDMKLIDLNEGLQSTLVLLRNNIPSHLKIVKELGNLPMVECQPGKINQVFMNLISNAVQAIKAKGNPEVEEYLTIKSWYIDQQVKISIKDSGIGMSEETKQRIFEPFFTTKDIGEGTGLGLSIVFSIIEKHKGTIEVNTKLNGGTEFIITLNVNP